MSKKSRTTGLKEKIRDWILRYGGITKEMAVREFGCRQHEAEQVLHELNLEGVVGQAQHVVCNDSYRGSKCWHPDVYHKRDEEGFTIFEVVVGLAILLGLVFVVVALFAMLKYVGWYG